jgi:hypothetical protein
MHESVKFLCNVLILVSLTGGTMALGLGSLQAFFTGSYNVVVGGASAAGVRHLLRQLVQQEL